MYPNFRTKEILGISKKNFFALFFFLFMINLGYDIFASFKWGGVDLRTRIVYARYLDFDYPLYSHKWSPGESERIIDPSECFIRVPNRNSGTPFLAVLLYPFSTLDYSFLRIFWTALNYMMLILFFVLIWRRFFKDKLDSPLLIGLPILFLFFLFTHSWHFLIERGQVYLIFMLIPFLCFMGFTSKTPWKLAVGSLILGMGIALRPIFILFWIPFLLKLEYKPFLWSIVGLATAILMTTQVPNGLNSWAEFNQSISEWSVRDIYEMELTEDMTPEFPKVIEGMPIEKMNSIKLFDVENISIQENVYTLFKIKIYPNQLKIALTAIMLLYLIIMWIKRKGLSLTALFLNVTTMVMMTELFIPAKRFNYNAVQWFFPIAILYVLLKNKAPAYLYLISAGLLLNCNMISWLPFHLPIGELLIMGTCFYYSLKVDDQIYTEKALV